MADDKPTTPTTPAPQVIYANSGGSSLTTILMFGVIGFLIWDRYQQPAPDDGTDPDRGRIDRKLAADLSAAIGANPEAATYFSKLCRGVSARLEIDGDHPTPIFTRKQEAFELAGNVGQLATSGINGMSFLDLPDVLVKHFAAAGFDDQTKGGELTASDRKALVLAWQQLSDAFEAIK